MDKKKKKQKEESSLSASFKEALPHFLPMLIGGALGGLDTGVAAQEGANQSMAQQQAAAQKAAELALEEEKLDKSTELKNRELDLKARGLDQDMQLGVMSIANKTGKKKQLSAELAKSLGHVQMGQAALADMQAAIDSGVNKFSLIGDNEFTFSKSRFTEALGRMQSGGAINKEEEKRFAEMAPGIADSEDIVKIKMKALNEEMARRFENITGEPSQMATVTKQADSLKDLASAVSMEELQAELQRRKQGQ